METTNYWTLALICLAAFAAIQLAKLYHCLFISPLRRIPGPWWAKFTGLPTKYFTTFQKAQARYYHSLHLQYGPYVRISPDEVLISDPVAFKKIHKIGSGFLKTKIYEHFNPLPPATPPFGPFQERDPVRHAAHRKLLARGFTQSSLRANWEATVKEKVGVLMEKMRREAYGGNGEVDLMKWLPLFTGDVICELMFGSSYEMLERGEPDEMLMADAKAQAGNMLAYNVPWLYQILKRIPSKKTKEYFSGNQVLIQRGKAAVEKSRNASLQTRAIFSSVLAEAEKDDPVLSEQETIVEAGAFIFGGTDTTATTLTYLLWSVLSEPKLQRDLEDEVSTLGEGFTDEQLERLPVLSATIRESLRLYGAAPAALPRVTPSLGATFGGYYIPPGTTVATQSWTMHRDPKLYPNAEKFDHTRWMSDLASHPAIKASWAPFGAGSRVCIGIHLAEMEMRHATASFFRAFQGARLAASTTPESMEVENIFLIAPKGHACRIILPREG